MERVDGKPECILMVAIFGETELGYYPYIVVEEDGKVRMIRLMEAIQEAFALLPLKNREKSIGVLELRFGLLDGQKRSYEQVGKELSSLTGNRVQQIVQKSLRDLRHPSRAKILKRFFILSPEKVLFYNKEISRLREESQSLKADNDRLRKILQGCHVSEEELEGTKPENLALTAEALAEDRKALCALIEKFPNNRVWNCFRRRGITELSRLKEIVRTKEIRLFRGLGKGAQKFLEEILQTTEKEASP